MTARPDSPLRLCRHHWMVDRDPSCFNEMPHTTGGRAALFCSGQIRFSGLRRADTATAARFVQVPADTAEASATGEHPLETQHFETLFEVTLSSCQPLFNQGVLS